MTFSEAGSLVICSENKMTDKGVVVRRLGYEDVQTLLPEAQPWDGTCAGADLFICPLGFEDRACAVPQLLAATLPEGAIKVSLLAGYDSNVEENECNGSKIRIALRHLSPRTQTFCADVPQETQHTIDEVLVDLKNPDGKTRVIFDISGASATLVMSVMAALLAHADSISLLVLFAEAQSYFPTQHQYDTDIEGLIQQGLADGDETSFAEQGVSDVDTNELYPGHSVENRPDHIIAIPSLRTARLVGCVVRIGEQPMASAGKSLFWILSEPPGPLRWRLDLQKRIVRRQLAKMSGREHTADDAPTLDEKNSTVCSTRDYRDVLGTLIDQVDAAGGMNLSLVNMGTQLQSVGVSLALHVRDELTVLRSRPKRFNVSQYTSGVGPMWKIEFDALPALLDGLRQIGTLQLQTKQEDARERRPSL
jgi:hypothetical protein